MPQAEMQDPSPKVNKPFTDAAVAQAFEAYPQNIRRRLLALRSLIYKTAAANPGVGELQETLKWGEPAYLPVASKSGSTVRLGWKKASPHQYAIYFNCQTDLVETFRTLFPKDFEFEGRRAIVFDDAAAVPTDALALCITAALTYHRNRKLAADRSQ